jgi:N-acetylneuraminic acid mutarotase
MQVNGLSSPHRPILQFVSRLAAAVSSRSQRTGFPAAFWLMALSVAGVCTSSEAQTGEWTWRGGSSTATSVPGVYGTLKTPAAGNIPGGREWASSWIDGSGHFWLFGGYGIDASGNLGYLNDLWEFNPSTNKWAWMSGSSKMGCGGEDGCGQSGVYGKLGTPAAGNAPGGRISASSWTDASGNLWLLGGDGYDAAIYGGYFGNLNDLWEFSPSTNEWVWMGGSNSTDVSGVYGRMGVPAAANMPGGREGASSWTDNADNLWLFGGGTFGESWGNDQWDFDPSTNEWTWMGGSKAVLNVKYGTVGEPGVYGTLEAPAAGNVPGSRDSAANWTDSGGNFWLFGGQGYDSSGDLGDLNDLWEFNPSTYEWAWMGGSDTLPCKISCGLSGAYGNLSVPAAGNAPGGRWLASSWTDNGGHLWLFGGNGYDASGDVGELNDLWEFNSFTNEWAWMGGNSTLNCEGVSSCGRPGVYGTLGMPAAGNAPGGRDGAVNWTDSSGHLWLFGGAGFITETTNGLLNDLWEYQPPTSSLPTAATPAFSVAAGIYPSPQTVSISDTTADATIYYTLDGATPADKSAKYVKALTIATTTTVQAVALATNYTISDVATATYTILQPQAIAFAQPASPVAFGVKPIALSATASSSLAVTFTVLSGPASVSGSTLTISGAGTVIVAANEAGSAVYLPAPQVTRTVIVNKAAQTIAFAPPPSPITYGARPITLLATASSDLAVTFSVVSGPAKLTGSALIIASAGIVVVAASQAGNANYLPAPQVRQSIVVNKAAQTIAFAPPHSPVTYGVKPITLNATASSGLSVTFSVLSGPARLAGSTLTITGAGPVAVTANQAGNADYSPAPRVTRTVTVNKASQTIAFAPPHSPVTYGAKPITLSAVASSGLSVTFSVLSGPASVAGSTLTVTGAGPVAVAANQAGNTDYSPAPRVTRTVTVNKASQTISFTAPASPVNYGAKPIALSATSSSGLAVTLSIVSGPGKVSGSTLTITGSGLVTVAANQAGSATYAAAPQVREGITVDKGTLTVAANNLSMKQGAAVPTLTYSIAGFVNKDTQANATTGKPALSTTATSKSVPGSYPISARSGTLAARNYSFTFVNGVLTVAP